MTVVSATTDHEARTLTVVAEIAAAPARLWQVWSDPRQLERWWGMTGALGQIDAMLAEG